MIMNVIDEKCLPLSEVRHILEEKERVYSKEGREMLYEQRRALEHAQKSAKISLKDTKELMKKLTELGLQFTEEQIVQVCDLLPETVDDVRAIFAKERFKYGEEDIKKVIDIVAQYR